MSPDSHRRFRGTSALFLALTLAACSKNLDMPRIKESIKAGIEKQSGVKVAWVECPDARKAKPGDRFECRAGVEGAAVTIDVVQDEYANAQWKQREDLLDLRTIEKTLQDGLKQNVSLDAVVTCQGTRVVAIPGTRFACAAAPSKGIEPFDIAVLIKDARGQVDWSIPKTTIDAAKAARPVKTR